MANQTLVVWREPNGEIPEGDMLVEVKTESGSDCALVFLGDDGETLYYSDEFEDVWTAWGWSNVTRYAMMEDVLVKL